MDNNNNTGPSITEWLIIFVVDLITWITLGVISMYE